MFATAAFAAERADAGAAQKVSEAFLAATDAGVHALPPVDVPLPDEETEATAPIAGTLAESAPTALVTTVDTRQLRGEAKDPAAMLAPVPGAVLQDSGGAGQRKTLSLRGAAGSGVLVLLDGMPLTSTGSGFDFSRLPSAMVDRLEVFRGSAAARLGPGALGGAVNAVTRDVSRHPAVFAEAGYGSFFSSNLNAGASGALLGGDTLLLAHAARSNGDFSWSFDSQPTLAGNAMERRVRENNDSTGGGALLRYRTSRGATRLELLAEGNGDSRGLAGTAINPTPDARQQNGRGSLSLRAAHGFEAGGELQLTGFGRGDFTRLEGGVFGSTPVQQLEHAAGAEGLYQRRFFGWHGVSALLSAGYEGVNVSDGTRPLRGRFSAMVGDDVSLLDGDLTVSASVRLDQTGPFTGVSPRLGVLAKLPAGFEVRANAGQAHRPPSFQELYVLQGTLAPNPNLKPERALFADAAVAWRHAKGHLELGGFASLYEDLISYEYYPPTLARPYNFAAARVAGLEAEGRVQPVRWLDLSASYTFLSTQNLRDDPRYYLKQLPYRPAHQLHGRLGGGVPLARGFVDVHYRSEQFINRTETVSIPPRVLLDAGVSSRFLDKPQLTASLVMKNLLDVQAWDLDGYPLPSRALYLTLQLDWSAGENR